MKRLHLIIYSVRNHVKPLLAVSLVLLSLSASRAQGLFTSDEDPSAPPVFAGSLAVRAVELAGQGDSLLLRMELVVKREAISKRQSWAIVPQLMAEEDGGHTQVTFPYALLNGSVRERLYARKLSFGNRELLANMPYVHTHISRDSGGEDAVLHYAVRVPYESWMDRADLKLHAILVSPAGKRQLLTIENAGRVKFASRVPYEVWPRVNIIEEEPEQKQRNIQQRAHLEFGVGKSMIVPTFRRNPEELARIAQTMASVQTNPDARITGLHIEGYASPEGSHAMNDKLARSRSEALRDYMAREYHMDRQLFSVGSMGEDWEGLRTLVQESSMTDAHRQAALAAIDSNDDYDRKELRLRKQTDTWRLMNAEMFPQLRRVEYRMDFRVKDDAATAINTAAMMLSRGELDEAKRMLDRAGDDPRAFNNLGVYYLLAGETDKAEEYLGKAIELGIREATFNMEELKKKVVGDEKRNAP